MRHAWRVSKSLTYSQREPLGHDGQDRNGDGAEALEDASLHGAQQETIAEPDREEPAQASAYGIDGLAFEQPLGVPAPSLTDLTAFGAA